MSATKYTPGSNATKSSQETTPPVISPSKEASAANSGGGGGGGATFNNLGSSNSFVALGVKTDGPGNTDGVLRDSGGNAIPSLVANFTPRTGTLASLLALAGNAGEIAAASDRQAIIKYVGTAGQGAVFFATPSMLANAVVTTTPANNVPGTFSTSATYTVGTHFTDNASALAFMQQCSALPGVLITLILAAGAVSTLVSVPMPWLKLSSAATTINLMQVAFTSVAVSGGADGARSLNFDVNTATDGGKFTVGQPFGILLTAHQGGAALSGTNKENIVGVNTVQSITVGTGANGVASGKTRITCNYALNATVDGVTQLPGAITGVMMVPPTWFTTSLDLSYFSSVVGIGSTTAASCFPSTGAQKAGSNASPYASCCIFAADLNVGAASSVWLNRCGVAGVLISNPGSVVINLDKTAVGSLNQASGTATGISLKAGACVVGDASITGQPINMDVGNRALFTSLSIIMSADADQLANNGSYAIFYGYGANIFAAGTLTLIRTTAIAPFAKDTPQATGNLLTY